MVYNATTPERPPPIPLYVTLPLSGLSGTFAWLFTHPFEIFKNRMISMQPSAAAVKMAQKGTLVEAPGMFTLAADLYRAEGLRNGWWKGIEAGLARQIVYTSARIALFDPVKRTFVYDRPATVFDRIAAGALSGAMAAFMSSPVEVALVRMSKQNKDSKQGFVQTLREIGVKDGLTGFWRGCIPLMTRASIVGVSQIAFYDQCQHTISQVNTSADLGFTHMQVNFASSIATGIFYSLVTMPVEVARLRITSDSSTPRKYRTMFQTIGLVYREEGLHRMYGAILPYLGRCCVHTIITLMLVEWGKASYLQNRFPAKHE